MKMYLAFKRQDQFNLRSREVGFVANQDNGFGVVKGVFRLAYNTFTKLAWVWLVLFVYGSPANAQNFTTTGTASDTIDASVACGLANLTKTIDVIGITTISDLNFGLIADHSWRGDIQLDLTSPAPNSVTARLLIADTTGTGAEDNYNVELDDEAAETINTGANDVSHDTSQAAFQFLASPNNALSAFEADTTPNGTWTVSIRDAEPNFDDGLFLQATLRFEPTTGADLTLSASPSNPAPIIGSTLALTFNITNSGPEPAGGVAAEIALPSGLSYLDQNGAGTFDDATGIWTLSGSIANNETASITLDVFVEPVGTYSTTAEIISSDKADIDSTPNNNSTTEDDDVTLNVSPVPPAAPPSLTCPVADQFTFAWSAPGTINGWNAGDLSNNYLSNGQALNFTISGNTESFIQFNSTDTPDTNQVLTGGLPAADGLFMLVNFPNNTDLVTTTLDVGTPGTGVGDLQFSIYDVDFAADGFVDRITVTGYLNGTAKYAVLTPGASNSVSGFAVTGNGASDLTSGAGNMTATFLSPVDQVVITYGNGSGAPANPLQQGITIAPITMCPPLAADLNAVKSVEVFDPLGQGLYMTPGNEVLYKITVTNSAAATAAAEDVDITDTLPSSLRFVSATTTGFTGGAFGTPDLPPANTDCEATPCIVRFSGGDVPINTTAEIEVRAIIK